MLDVGNREGSLLRVVDSPSLSAHNGSLKIASLSDARDLREGALVPLPRHR